MPREPGSFIQRYMKALVGCTIIATGATIDGFPFFVASDEHGVEYKCEVSQDEEGNGPGFLFGLPMPRSEQP